MIMIALDVSIIEGFFNSIILLNLGISLIFHINNFTILSLIEDYICSISHKIYIGSIRSNCNMGGNFQVKLF